MSDTIHETNLVDAFEQVQQPTQVVEEPELSSEDMLRFVQAKRLAFINQIEKAADGQIAELTTGKQMLYATLLKDLEGQVLDKMKIQAEGDSAKLNNEIASLLTHHAIESNRAANRVSANIPVEKIIPSAEVLPVKSLVPGETEIGDQLTNYDLFFGRVETQD